MFSGLVTYYIEGPPAQRRNLMDTTVAKANVSWGVRGNLFSFLLPWERILSELFQKVEDGNLSSWPLEPKEALKLVRVKFENGSETMLDKFRDLYVRSKVVKRLAGIYVERKINDLRERAGVIQIHSVQKGESD